MRQSLTPIVLSAIILTGIISQPAAAQVASLYRPVILEVERPASYYATLARSAQTPEQSALPSLAPITTGNASGVRGMTSANSQGAAVPSINGQPANFAPSLVSPPAGVGYYAGLGTQSPTRPPTQYVVQTASPSACTCTCAGSNIVMYRPPSFSVTGVYRIPPPGSYYFGRGILGQMKVYRPGQPIRNAVRFVTP